MPPAGQNPGATKIPLPLRARDKKQAATSAYSKLKGLKYEIIRIGGFLPIAKQFLTCNNLIEKCGLPRTHNSVTY